MPNYRPQPVTYTPFKAKPLLAEGLLAVARPGGEFMERVAQGIARTRGELDAFADSRTREMASEMALRQRNPVKIKVTGGERTQAAGGAVDGGNAHDVAKRILRQEEGFRDTPYWDVNADRIGYGSDTVTDAAGKVARVTKGMKISRGDAERDLDRRLSSEFGPTAAGQVGQDKWGALPAATQGVLMSVAYNYGSLPKSVVKAVRDGGDVAAAVEALSSNRERRGREAAIIRAGDTGVGEAAVVEASGGPVQISVSGGGFRPTGRDTIFGRAYDEAGSRAYVQGLEAEMRATAGQLFEKFADDPAGLASAFADLTGQLKQDHVFPEIEGDFDVAMTNLATRYLESARERQAVKIEAQDRARFIERTTALETEQQRQLAAFDPATGNAAEAIASTQATIDDHYDAAVDRGLLDADDAATAKTQSRKQAAVAYYLKQASAKDAAGVAAMRAELTKDFADGGVDGLEGAGYSELDTALATMSEAKQEDDARAARALAAEGEKLAFLAANGTPPPQGMLAAYRLKAGSTANGKQIVAATDAQISAAKFIAARPSAEGAAYVAGLRRQYGAEMTAEQAATIAFAEKALEAKRKAIETDAVTYAERQSIVPATGNIADAGSAEELMSVAAQRAASAREAGERLGIQPRYLKEGEAKAFAARVLKNPEEGAMMAASIVAGAGADAPAMLSEFGADAPMIAEAGAILAFGGSARAAEDVIGGYARVDGKALKGLKADAARESFDGTAGTALALAPKDRERIERAAASIARKRISELGLDPETEEAIALHAQAVHEAAGAVFDRGDQWGGFAEIGGGLWRSAATVMVPPSIRADRFEDVIAAIRDEDLAALPVKPKAGVASTRYLPFLSVQSERGLAATLAGATPVAVAGGYAFAFGDPSGDDAQFVQGSDGAIFVLNLDQLRPQLASRVPGAFR